MINTPLYPMMFKPLIKNYVWGGRRLAALLPPQSDTKTADPIAEAWVIYEGNEILNGDFKGKTLGEMALRFPIELLGSRAAIKPGEKFPLLIKLLDCAQWLSIQVHPNDDQARRLEGQQFNGKIEAWYILDAQPGTRLIAGTRKGITRDTLEKYIRAGKILDGVQYHEIHASDTVFIDAGTVHALGPGALVYEVQQNSDITYRVYDWDRPRTPERKLHIDQSIAVIDPEIQVDVKTGQHGAGASATLVDCPYFKLELVSSQDAGIEMSTDNLSFHALTVIEGAVCMEGQGTCTNVGKHETILMPASYGTYRLSGTFQILKASI